VSGRGIQEIGLNTNQIKSNDTIEQFVFAHLVGLLGIRFLLSIFSFLATNFDLASPRKPITCNWTSALRLIMDTKQLFDVSGKVVLVTGGAKGIGGMISSGFVAAGARVYISSRKANDCERTAKELTERGPGKCIAIPADLMKLEDCHRLVKQLSERESSNVLCTRI